MSSKPKRPRGKRGSRAKYLQPQPQTFEDFATIQPGTPVVLWCRVSTADQRPNLTNQEDALRAAVAAAGGQVVVVRHQ